MDKVLMIALGLAVLLVTLVVVLNFAKVDWLFFPTGLAFTLPQLHSITGK